MTHAANRPPAIPAAIPLPIFARMACILRHAAANRRVFTHHPARYCSVADSVLEFPSLLTRVTVTDTIDDAPPDTVNGCVYRNWLPN